MIKFTYLHVPTNRNLEKYTSNLLQTYINKGAIEHAEISFRKEFDFKNRCREVVTIQVFTNGQNLQCEIATATFKKSVSKAVETIGRKISGAEPDLISA